MATHESRPDGSLSEVLRLAAWFALLAALGEAAIFLILQPMRLLAGPRLLLPIEPQIVWAALLVNGAIFGFVTLLLIALCRWLPARGGRGLTVFVFAFLTAFDWLAVPGYVGRTGVIALAAGCAVVLMRWTRTGRGEHFFRLVRRTVSPLAAVALAAAGFVVLVPPVVERIATARLPDAAAGAPNVLFIVIDTLRSDHVSAYGYGRPTTPVVDGIARQGVLFENAYATSSWTLPSHGSLLTGRYTFEHNAGDTEPRLTPRHLDDRHPTLAEVLRRNGYRTGAFSGNVYYFNRWEGFARGFLHFEDLFETAEDAFRRTLFGRHLVPYVTRHIASPAGLGRRTAEEISDATLDWIGTDPAKPFFAFLNYFDIHDPYYPPPSHLGRFGTPRDHQPLLNEDLSQFPALTPAQLEHEVSAYDESLAYVDEQIGHLLDALRQRGQLDRTLVVITSDHGESFGEHRLFQHRNALYREQLQVPMVLQMTGRMPAGLRVPDAVTIASLPSTVLALIGAAADFPLPSLTHHWTDERPTPKPARVIAEIARFPYKHAERPSTHGRLRSIVSGTWQLVLHEGIGCGLFDVSRDPGQTTNLADDDGYRQVRDTLASELTAAVTPFRRLGPRGVSCIMPRAPVAE